MPNEKVPLSPTVHLGYLTDDAFIDHVSRARKSIRFVGPGVSVKVARAFVTCWRQLPPAAIELILDAGSDLCRLGFGDGEALAILLDAAHQLGVQVHRQPGVRLCVLDVDGERRIFSPAPRLVEAPGRQSSHIILAPSHGEPLHETIWAPPELAPVPMTPAIVAKVQQELKESPAQPFRFGPAGEGIEYKVSVRRVQYPKCRAIAKASTGSSRSIGAFNRFGYRGTSSGEFSTGWKR
jgi:hypothetical protein